MCVCIVSLYAVVHILFSTYVCISFSRGGAAVSLGPINCFTSSGVCLLSSQRHCAVEAFVTVRFVVVIIIMTYYYNCYGFHITSRIIWLQVVIVNFGRYSSLGLVCVLPYVRRLTVVNDNFTSELRKYRYE